MAAKHRATVPVALSWESQVVQYRDAEPPASGEGITYFPGPTSLGVVDCLLFWQRRGGKARIVGILNHFPVDMPPWERAGNVNVWVRRPQQRQGIGTALYDEAVRRWGIDLERQQFTVEGAPFADYLASRPAEPGGSGQKE